MATNWTIQTPNYTNWSSTGGSTATVGTPIGMLMGLTREETVTTPGVNPTNWDGGTANATGWGNANVFTGGILFQNGSGLLMQDGEGLLIP